MALVGKLADKYLRNSHEQARVHHPLSGVCQMTSINGDLLLNYQGVEHYFCSSQCLERFQSHPHLYVGDPRYGLSVKQKGEVVIKEHKIRVSVEFTDETKNRLEATLKMLMGVETVGFDSDTVYVTYDLLQVSLADIEKAIVASACQLDSGFSENIKRGYIHYTEECELDNLAHLINEGKCH